MSSHLLAQHIAWCLLAFMLCLLRGHMYGWWWYACLFVFASVLCPTVMNEHVYEWEWSGLPPVKLCILGITSFLLLAHKYFDGSYSTAFDLYSSSSVLLLPFLFTIAISAISEDPTHTPTDDENNNTTNMIYSCNICPFLYSLMSLPHSPLPLLPPPPLLSRRLALASCSKQFWNTVYDSIKQFVSSNSWFPPFFGVCD